MADTLLAPFEDGDDISFHICIEEGFILSASVCDVTLAVGAQTMRRMAAMSRH